MAKKIIEHDNQTFMFDGEYTQPIEKTFDFNNMKLSDIDFDNSHLVIQFLVNKDRKVSQALHNELRFQL